MYIYIYIYIYRERERERERERWRERERLYTIIYKGFISKGISLQSLSVTCSKTQWWLAEIHLLLVEKLDRYSLQNFFQNPFITCYGIVLSLILRFTCYLVAKLTRRKIDLLGALKIISILVLPLSWNFHVILTKYYTSLL